MRRREFLKTTGALLTTTIGGVSNRSFPTAQTAVERYRFYKGFNLPEKMGADLTKKYDERDFEIIAEWGMNFVRLPLSYWSWSSRDNWYIIREEALKDIDDAIDCGRQYNLHISLSFVRMPGYCVSYRDQEPMDLFDDTPERMQRALDATVFHWSYFTRRYKGISSEQLSFDLINEPPRTRDDKRYEVIIRTLVNAIRAEDPSRLIVVEGKIYGRQPALGFEDLNVVQSTRGYSPMSISHYHAPWINANEFETLDVPTWPLKADNGLVWDKALLKERLIEPWRPLIDSGVQIHVGEWGCYNQTPHSVVLAWARDILSIWKEVDWGNALWHLRGPFGVLDSDRKDVKYEDFKGHKLDRELLELLKEFQ